MKVVKKRGPTKMERRLAAKRATKQAAQKKKKSDWGSEAKRLSNLSSAFGRLDGVPLYKTR
jgi:hypothetical protein